jgi:site-specific recombinase XerD
MSSVAISEAVGLFIQHRTPNVTEKTVGLYYYYFQNWQNWRASEHLGEQVQDIVVGEFRAFMVYLKEQRNWDASSIDRIWSMLRAFWNFLNRDDKLTEKQARFFQGDRVPRPRIETKIREIYTDEQIDTLVQNADVRGQAIILLLLESGMRASELCSLTGDRVDLEARQGVVVGKGRVERYVWWGHRAASALQRYLADRPEGFGFLVRCQNGKKLTVNAIQSMLHRLARRIGMKLPPRAIHTFRHTFARRALMSGIDVLHLQQFLGHSSSKTTERYVRECPEQLRKVHQRIWTE